MKKILIVWNPVAGGKAASIIKKLKAILEQRNIDFRIADTHLTKSAKITVKDRLNDSFSDLMIVGGDGTINEAINGLEYDIPVSIIPAGTGDDFVKMIEIGKSLKQQIDTAIDGEIVQIDLGVCNERKFINGVGIGFDGQIVEDMISKRVPLLTGHAAYYYHVLRILGGYKEKEFDYKIDEIEYSKELILLTIGNGSTFGGGFKLMPQAKIDDGWLEVCEIGKISGLRRFLNVGRLSKGTHGKLNTINFYRARGVSVKSNSMLFAHIDGERLGNPPFDIKVLPSELKLRVKK